MKILIVLCFLLSTQARASIPGTASDIGVVAMSAAGIAVQDTWEKRGIAAASQAFNLGLTYLLKKGFALTGLDLAERPDGTDNEGMPSGHTSQSFTAAGNICWARPGLTCAGAFAAASGIGYARVAAKRHSWEQVGIGAGLGIVNGSIAPKLVFTKNF